MFLFTKYTTLFVPIIKKPFQFKVIGRLFSRPLMDKIRENPIVTRLESPEFKNIFTPELNALFTLFTKYNYELRIAGGAVRDLLMGKKPKDIDFATNATPEQMKTMFTQEEIRMINDKGEKHGTITARINEKENFEITTLRIDVLTDGRHAEVEFTKDWLLDANRRDLTINSMFLDFNGDVYDYFFGYEDLKERKVVFVGDADTRIKEDYLRILRYFRFYGRIAEQPDGHDEITLRIISQNVAGLEQISGERIWSELSKILECHFAGELMKTMLHCGVGKYCGFPETPNIDELTRVWERSRHLNLQAVTLLAALLDDSRIVNTMHSRLKWPNTVKDLVLFIIEQRPLYPTLPDPITHYKKLTVNSKGNANLKSMHQWCVEILKYFNSPLLDQFRNWTMPNFPINGKMLNEKFGIKFGKQMGPIIQELKIHWVNSGLDPDPEKLLEAVPNILEKIEENIEEKREKSK